ncbi:transposable element Tcb2 transposase [Trichonephila clavipes]|nr:transposable element Tcb2 transposase [Trichonephila clavipes]
MLGPVDLKDFIYMKTRLRTLLTDQSSRRAPHRKKGTLTANCFISRHPVVLRTRKLDFRGTEPVFLIDESRLNLSSDDNLVRVWRQRCERLNHVFALQQHTAPTASVMAWGAISYSTQSPLVLIRGTMQRSGMSMPSCNHMCCLSCKGFQDAFSTRQC